MSYDTQSNILANSFFNNLKKNIIYFDRHYLAQSLFKHDQNKFWKTIKKIFQIVKETAFKYTTAKNI